MTTIETTASESQESSKSAAHEPGAFDPKARAAAITDGLVDIGSMWARHGLSVGRSALEASAKTLKATAELLGNIADSFEAKKPEGDDAAKPAALVERRTGRVVRATKGSRTTGQEDASVRSCRRSPGADQQPHGGNTHGRSTAVHQWRPFRRLGLPARARRHPAPRWRALLRVRARDGQITKARRSPGLLGAARAARATVASAAARGPSTRPRFPSGASGRAAGRAADPSGTSGWASGRAAGPSGASGR